MTIAISSIVEGDGEVAALPLLLRRLGMDICPQHWVQAHYPIKVPRDKLLKPKQLERYFRLAVAQAANCGVLIVLDAEDREHGCPAKLGPQIKERASVERDDVPTLVVIAKNEYEAWFLAAAESLRGQRRLRQDIESPVDPEAIRGAKEWLQERMSTGSGYSETIDQPALTEVFDLQAARRSPSFDRFYRRFGEFCEQITKQTAA